MTGNPHSGSTPREPQPGDDRERTLMNLMKAGDFDARQNMIACNLRLVLNGNRRYANKGVRLFDLLKAGNLGLEHALENFETEGKGRFSAYAAHCIRQNIEHTIQNWDSRRPPPLGKPDHDRYRIVADNGTNPSAVHLIRDHGLPPHDQID